MQGPLPQRIPVPWPGGSWHISGESQASSCFGQWSHTPSGVQGSPPQSAALRQSFEQVIRPFSGAMPFKQGFPQVPFAPQRRPGSPGATVQSTASHSAGTGQVGAGEGALAPLAIAEALVAGAVVRGAALASAAAVGGALVIAVEALGLGVSLVAVTLWRGHPARSSADRRPAWRSGAFLRMADPIAAGGKATLPHHRISARSMSDRG